VAPTTATSKDGVKAAEPMLRATQWGAVVFVVMAC